MAIYRYEKQVEVSSQEEIELRVECPLSGSTSVHKIMLDESHEVEKENDFAMLLGSGPQLADKTILIYSRVANVNPDHDELHASYYINGALILKHRNLKNDTLSPQLKIKIKFV